MQTAANIRLGLWFGMAALACAGAASAQTKPVGGPLLGSESPEATQSFSLSAGASAWTGDYGAPSTTDIAAVLLGARYQFGDLRLSATVPWMRISSAGAVFTGIAGTPLIVSPQAGTVRTVRDGLGDLTLGASYLAARQEKFGADIDLTGQVKLPTASDPSGLSTGRADYSAGAEVSRSFGSLIPFVSVTYRSFGDSRDWKLRDGVAASVGASYVFRSRLIGVLSYDYAQSATRFVPDSQELVASVSTPVGRTPLRVTGFAASGLSNGSAAFSGGVSVSYQH